MSHIVLTRNAMRREPLKRPFGFKGGALSQLWQTACLIEDDEGTRGLGLGVQSVLWSDATLSAQLGQEKGNRLMFSLTQYALSLLKGRELCRPDLMTGQLIPAVWDYGRSHGFPSMRLTFVLNALTPVDWALWQLYARKTGCLHFERLVSPLTQSLCARQQLLGNIPLISYDTTEEEIRALADQGIFLYKIKIGSAPAGPADLDAMLRWDIARLKQVHSLVGDRVTPYTDCGYPLYYLDANGRYDTTDRIMALLDALDHDGILERVLLLEEPVPEEHLQDVSRLPVRVAGDESAHSHTDAIHLMDDYGYSAIALKPIAKTLSVTLQICEEAAKRQIPCFCADLTVNPAMVEYSKNIAARLSPLPGLKAGVLESNGAQNYQNWEEMKKLNPAQGYPWAEADNSLYHLDDSYYACDGGIWLPYTEYESWLS